MLDIERIRADTPGCHSKIHFNNAGSSLPPGPVVDAVVDYLRAEELIGGYEAQADRESDLERVYDATATLLGCHRSEVAFTASASDAWWRAFSAVPLHAGDRILISHSEFQSNAFGFLQARARGVVVDLVPNDSTGCLDVDALQEMLDERVKLISVTQVSMSNGAVQPAAEVGRVVADHPALYLLDACQAAGQLPLNVTELGCDFLVYTGRKWLRGPRGTGILYAKATSMGLLGPQPFVDGRSAEWLDDDSYELHPDARRFEFGEQNYAGKAGLAVATDYLLDLGVDAVAARVGRLADRLRDGLESIADVEVRDEGGPRCGIVTATVRGTATPEMGAALRNKGLQLSVPGRRNAQHDLGARGIEAVLRAAPHYFNTEDEIDRALELISEL